jgi:3-hydroxyacyl-CoA dehydrogenase
VPSAEEAVTGADFVQENGPERLDFKRELFRRMDEAADPGVPLASSSSTLMVSEFQDLCATPGRVLLGHPFNPPHLSPLVEVVGGRQTHTATLEQAVAFYTAMGKHPIVLKREKRGHVANRLQAALWQEAIHLVAEGVASVADVDAAIAHGPGLRWALLGPFLNLHLSGGAGGMRHMLAHLGPPTESMWRDLGSMSLSPAVTAMVVAGSDDELAGLDMAETVQRRDDVLVRLLQMKEAAKLP